MGAFLAQLEKEYPSITEGTVSPNATPPAWVICPSEPPDAMEEEPVEKKYKTVLKSKNDFFFKKNRVFLALPILAFPNLLFGRSTKIRAMPNPLFWVHGGLQTDL